MSKIIILLFSLTSILAVNIYSQQPVLSYPANGSVINTLTPILQWGGLGANHSRVRVQVDTTYNFFFPTVIDVELPQYTTSFSVPIGRLQYNKLYYWKVGAYYYPGYYYYSTVFSFTSTITGINIVSEESPDKFNLSQNYPNPFNPSTKIRFEIPAASSVAQTFLSVFDVLGKQVALLVNQNLQPGTYDVNWSASDFPSGIYFYTLKSGDYKQTRKMILIK